MKILSRYVLKEHLGPLVFSLSALTSLLLLNYIAKRFGELVGKGLPWTVIAEFFVLSIPFTLALTMPMAVLVATLHAFSRLASENEITALKASGVSPWRLMVPVLFAAAGVTLFMVIFNDQVWSRANHELAVLQSDIAQKKPTFALREQVINEVSPGKLFLRANHLDEASNRMRDVTIYDLSDATRRRTIYADSGNIALARNQSDLLMTLYHGSMQDVPVQNPKELQRLYYNVDLVTVKGVANKFQKSSTAQSKGSREMSVCEMQHEVNVGLNDYIAARDAFLAGIRTARTQHLSLDPEITHTKVRAVPHLTLGGAYCGLIRSFGVKSLGAQSAHRLGGLLTQGRPRQPAGGIPNEAPKPPVGVITAAPSSTPLPPSMGISNEVTPSTIVVSKVRMLDAQVLVDSYEIEIHKKFALAVACFVFVLLGAPIALRFPRGGVGLTIGVSLFVFALYYIGLTAGAAVATQGLLPAGVAMWAANVVFTLVALVLLKKMGKEGNTARGGDFSEVMTGLRTWAASRLRAVHIMSERRGTT